MKSPNDCTCLYLESHICPFGLLTRVPNDNCPAHGGPKAKDEKKPAPTRPIDRAA